jgi:hypothetical protein
LKIIQKEGIFYYDKEIKIRGIQDIFDKINPKTKKRRNLGTFKTLAAAKKHEKEIQYFKRH